VYSSDEGRTTVQVIKTVSAFLHSDDGNVGVGNQSTVTAQRGTTHHEEQQI